MSAQLALGYSPAYVGGEIWKARLDLLRSAVNHLGLKDVAWALDISGSQLSDAVNERDRKRWAGEWLDVVKQMLLQRHDEIAIDIYRRLVDLDTANSPFVVVEDDGLTPEEESAALKRELLKFGDAGRAIVERYRKRRRAR